MCANDYMKLNLRGVKMGYLIKKNEKEARERLRAFWAGESLGRPALYITANNHLHTKNIWKETGCTKKEKDYMPEWHAWYNKEFINSTVFLAEAMPCATLKWGSLLTTVAMLAGGEYEYHNSQQEDGNGLLGSAWIKLLPEVLDEPLPAFNSSHSTVKFLEKCIYSIHQAIGSMGFINPPIMLDGLTTLSMFLNPDNLCYAILETPAKVKSWSNALTDIYIHAYDHFYNLIKKLGYGDTSSWLSAMGEGRLEAVQCDFATMISPKMFEEFVLPDLYRVTEYMDYSLYHLDGTCQMRFIDSLRSLPKLNGIQWNPEPKAGSPVYWIDSFKEIRRRKLCLHIACNNVEEVVLITKELGPDGMFFVLPPFESEQEAENAVKLIEKAC
jgi:hypothetical protein